ncbi:hypothetical protein DFQ30_006137 [Apophysomyces sp. BC1015]|nr:hypothetical protein DFQ30_006137 [Apophysomyces sp. BC1015]
MTFSDLAHIDKRTAHNALERQRREGLNNKFQQLAHALPSLQTVCRPSKTMIVTKSLEFGNSVQREIQFQKQIQLLCKENDRLRKKAHKSSIQLRKKASAEKPRTTTPMIKGNLSPPPSPDGSPAKTKNQPDIRAMEQTVSPVAYSHALMPAEFSPVAPPPLLPGSSTTAVEILTSPLDEGCALENCGTPHGMQPYNTAPQSDNYFYHPQVTEPLLTQETPTSMAAYYYYDNSLVTASPSTAATTPSFPSFLPTTFVSPYMQNSGKLKV